jgi:peroxiredoxin
MKKSHYLSLTILGAVAIAMFAVFGQLSGPAVAAEEEPMAAGLPEAPAFTLTDIHGNEHSLADFKGKYVVLEWFNSGCPFVKKFYKPGKMQELQKHYTEKGIVWLTICSSAEGKQGHHTSDEWKKLAKEWDISSTGILVDADGKVGKAYGAKTTPHMFVINPDGKLIYQGAIDSDSSPSSDAIEKADNYVVKVLDAALLTETRSYGCSVKY